MITEKERTAGKPRAAKEAVVINGFSYVPKVGTYVVMDGNYIGEALLEGTPYCDESFPGCEFRWPNPIAGWETKHAIACNVYFTGRTKQYRLGGSAFIKGVVEWVGDGEPNTYVPCWILAEGKTGCEKLDAHEINPIFRPAA